MIVIWFNGMISKYKETVYVDTSDMKEITPEAVNDIMKVNVTYKGKVIGTTSHIDFMPSMAKSNLFRCKNLHETISMYTLTSNLGKIAQGRRGRVHMMDRHHQVVAHVIRQKIVIVGRQEYDSLRLIELFTHAYKYDPMDTSARP